MLDFLARILRNNTPASADWLGRHPNAQTVDFVENDFGYQIVYRDRNQRATYDTDALGNVRRVEVSE